MNSKEEKLSLLSEMIQFAKADKKYKEQEHSFILAVASQLGVTREEVGELIENGVDKKPLQPESQRILQFHRLVLLMNVDQEASQIEIHKIKNIGLQMGLRPEAIDTVLKEMHNYPNKVIPPDELIAIFSRFYN
ncbi:TerB family tellurite resistance protein [Aquimarina sp. 2201CG5-10]|uniref:TerB family tellurite resistance protein n=1 Tax=Aquimarina callyspongiae TaxID=3098150 RepID=UPI002AB4FEE4|nr:TerB family tellurite resistance protein [Aquimarina sp. 2201CG5-10]MDY8134035.1 TerB family tellurite resistance protein [Aquimarina sp. 2201CG5-10]